MPFYRKRAVVIDANEWTGGLMSANQIIAWARNYGTEIEFHESFGGTVLTIETLEGTMTAQIGDFIIRGVQNEFYPCKPDIFWQTYEEL